MRYALLCWVLLFSPAGNAYLTSDFDFSWGFTSIQVDVGGFFKRSIESLASFEFNYNLKVPGPSLSITLTGAEILGTEFGTLPMTHLGVGVRWYPRGLNGGRMIMDSGVSGRVWKPSPFLGLATGVTNISVQEVNESDGAQGFNAAVFDLQLALGVEIPLTSDILLVGQFKGLSSLSSSTASGLPSFSYSGYQLMAGLKATPF